MCCKTVNWNRDTIHFVEIFFKFVSLSRSYLFLKHCTLICKFSSGGKNCGRRLSHYLIWPSLQLIIVELDISQFYRYKTITSQGNIGWGRLCGTTESSRSSELKSTRLFSQLLFPRPRINFQFLPLTLLTLGNACVTKSQLELESHGKLVV